MNFIQDSFEIFPQHFKCTFHWLLQVYSITQKMYIFEYAWNFFLEVLTFLKCRETFEKLLQLVAFLKMLLFTGIFLP